MGNLIEGKNIPELRFPGFTGEWEEKKLGKVFDFRKGKGISKSDLSSKGTKCILYGQLYTIYNEVIANVESYTEINKEKLLLSKYGDILIPSSGETALDMSLSSAILLDDIALGGDINVLRPKKNNVDSKFISYQINSARKLDLARVAEGASVIHLYNSSIKSIRATFPSLSEQEKISSFFYTLDQKLDLQNKRIEKLKNYKKGMMQRIFNQEIRFKDEEGKEYPEWEEKKLGEILKEKKEMLEKGQGVPHASLTKNGIELKTERYDRDFLVTTKDKKYKVSKLGDICYNPANLKFGVITINTIGTVIFSPIYITFVVNKNISERYLSYYLMRWDFINTVRKFEEGTVYERMAVKPVDFLKYKIKLPSLPEQEKIASFLSDVDNKIELEEERLKAYEKLKKGLMQRMFV